MSHTLNSIMIMIQILAVPATKTGLCFRKGAEQMNCSILAGHQNQEEIDMTHIQLDGRGNKFVEMEGVRITYVREDTRDPEKRWAGGDTLRFQAYHDPESNSALRWGPEILLGDRRAALTLLAALAGLLAEAT